MVFNVRFYCNNCHREGQMQLIRRCTREEIEHQGKCIHCSTKGKLRLIVAK